MTTKATLLSLFAAVTYAQTFTATTVNGYCRGPGGANLATYYTVTTATTAGECQQKCVSNPTSCKGVEFQPAAQRCELWTTGISSTLAAQSADVTCYLHRAASQGPPPIGQPVVPTPASLPTPAPPTNIPPQAVGFRSLGANTFCRDARGGNDPDSFQLVPAATSDECQNRCLAQPACVGIEIQWLDPIKCELWFGRIGTTASSLTNGIKSTCFMKTGNQDPPPGTIPVPEGPIPVPGSPTPAGAVPSAPPSAAPRPPTPQPIPSSLQFNLQFPDNSLTPTQKQAFEKAKATMECFVKGVKGLANYQITIQAAGKAIDGVGKILGSAGPNRITTSPQGFTLPISGAMQFDTADLAKMETDGILAGVVTHEMMHVFGLGTLWQMNGCALAACPAVGSDNWVRTKCPAAYAEYQKFGGTGELPLENRGGQGTACGHWREVTFKNEIATGFAEKFMPLSRMTVASYADLGYIVDTSCREIDQLFKLDANAARVQMLENAEVLNLNMEQVSMTDDWWENRRMGKPLPPVPMLPLEQPTGDNIASTTTNPDSPTTTNPDSGFDLSASSSTVVASVVVSLVSSLVSVFFVC